MTDAQLAKAERLRTAAGLQHVRFLDGHIKRLSMPDAAVDMVISNGMINLSADKPAVFAEAFRGPAAGRPARPGRHRRRGALAESITCNAVVRWDAATAAASLRIGGKRGDPDACPH